MATAEELTRKRAEELAAAIKSGAAAEAVADDLREQLAEATYLRDLAEDALSAVEFGDYQGRRVFVPGDDEPTDEVMVLASVSGRGIHYTDASKAWRGDTRWAEAGYPTSVYTWSNVLEAAPLLDITGVGAEHVVTVFEQYEKARRDAMRVVSDAEQWLDDRRRHGGQVRSLYEPVGRASHSAPIGDHVSAVIAAYQATIANLLASQTVAAGGQR